MQSAALACIRSSEGVCESHASGQPPAAQRSDAAARAGKLYLTGAALHEFSRSLLGISALASHRCFIKRRLLRRIALALFILVRPS